MVETFKSQPPKNMAAVTNVYGTLIESVGRVAAKANTDATALPDAAKEQVRRAMYAADFQATMTVDESADLYALDEARKFGNILRRSSGFISKVELGRPRPMLMADRRQPGDGECFSGRCKPPWPGPAAHSGGLHRDRVRPIERGSGRWR